MEDAKKIDFSFLSNITPKNDEEIENAERKIKAAHELERRAKLDKDYITNSNVPYRFQKESLDTYIPTASNKKVYDWIKGFTIAVEQKKNTKNILYINGGFGLGKSHLGCGIIRQLGGYIITSLELCITYDSCRDFRATQTRIEFLKNLCKYRVLVIDEIGKGIERIEKEIMPYIINEFYGSGNILIFLGNGSRSDFNAIIGEAGVDRMEESGVFLALVGKSIRCKQ